MLPLVEVEDLKDLTKSRLLWIDLEMTGLSETKDSIMEVAAIVTDNTFKSVAIFESRAPHLPDAILNNMDPWCVSTHGKSGLTQRCRESKESLYAIEADLIAFCKEHIGDAKIIICGNSIHTDRKFIDRTMPRFAKTLHYKMVDVTSFKIIINRLFPSYPDYIKQDTHRAYDDIMESIGEMMHYSKILSRGMMS